MLQGKHLHSKPSSFLGKLLPDFFFLHTWSSVRCQTCYCGWSPSAHAPRFTCSPRVQLFRHPPWIWRARYPWNFPRLRWSNRTPQEFCSALVKLLMKLEKTNCRAWLHQYKRYAGQRLAHPNWGGAWTSPSRRQSWRDGATGLQTMIQHRGPTVKLTKRCPGLNSRGIWPSFGMALSQPLCN